MCVINESVFHTYPKVVKWMRYFRPFSFIYRFLKEVNEPGIVYRSPRWLAAIAGWTPLYRLSNVVWWLMGSPGKWKSPLFVE